MKISFMMYPPEGDRFASTAFDDQIGNIVPFLAESGVSRAKLLAAKVAEDGSHAELTVEGDLRLPPAPLDAFSLGRMEDT